MTDIIWALVVVYSVGVAVWLIYTLGHEKTTEKLQAKTDERQLAHERRINLLEKGLLHTQQELVNAKDSVTSIENRLGPQPPSKASKRWPGEG